MEKKTIMLIDDDFDLLKQLEIQFHKAGFNVVTANSGEVAEDILRNFKPNAVVTDLMMENIDDGFSLSYHIKRIDPTIPVIVITGATKDLGFKFQVNESEGNKWIKADAVLSKPIAFDDLLAELNKHLI